MTAPRWAVDDGPGDAYEGFDWPVVASIAVVLLLFVGLMFDVASPWPPRRPAVPAVAATSTTTTTAATPSGTTSAPAIRSASTSDTSPTTSVTTAAPSTTTPPLRRRLSSTMYCENGTTASGAQTGPGVVAVSFADFPSMVGTTWRVLDGPHAGRVFTVEDKGRLAHFDMWTGSCDEAIRYGRRLITVEAVRS